MMVWLLAGVVRVVVIGCGVVCRGLVCGGIVSCAIVYRVILYRSIVYCGQFVGGFGKAGSVE